VVLTQQQNNRIYACETNVISQLPQQIRLAVQEVVLSGPTSQYDFRIFEAGYQFQLLVMERNVDEAYTVCHCFSTDSHDLDYGYESMSLASIRAFTKMAEKLNIT